MTLSDWLKSKGRTQAWFAARVGRSQGQVSNWITGRNLVPLELCATVSRATRGQVRCRDLRPDFDWGNK